MQNISLNKKLVISANKTAEIQEKRFFIKMLEKKRKCLLKLLIHETDVPYGRGNCNVSTNKHMEENHLWYISNSDGADFVRLGAKNIALIRLSAFSTTEGSSGLIFL